jgi:hypothetical protein
MSRYCGALRIAEQEGLTLPRVAGNVSYAELNDPNVSRSLVDEAYCNRIRCGEITQEQAGMLDVYACSQAGFVGAWAGCEAAIPVSPAIQQSPEDSKQPLTTATLTQPFPDITASLRAEDMLDVSEPFWCSLNKAIAANPICASLALGLAFFALAKKGR